MPRPPAHPPVVWDVFLFIAVLCAKNGFPQDAAALYEEERELARAREAEAGVAMKRLEALKVSQTRIFVSCTLLAATAQPLYFS